MTAGLLEGSGARDASARRAPTIERDIVFAKRTRSGSALYSISPAGGEPKRLTTLRRITWKCGCRSGDFDDYPLWSPDGKRIAFSRGAGVYVMNADGSGAHRLAASAEAEDYDPAWAPAGITFVRSRPSVWGYVEEILIAPWEGGAVRVLAPASRLGYGNPRQLKNVIPRTVPPITLKGGPAYRDAISAELRQVLTKKRTPEQAAKSLARRWDRITEERGVETQVEALTTYYQGFPTIADAPDRDLPVEPVSTVVR